MKKKFKTITSIKRRFSSKVLITALACISLMASCSDDDDDDAPPVSGSTNGTLTMNISGLEDLGPTAQYEGWIMVDGTPISIGTFTVDVAKTPSATTFSVNSDQLAAATKYILTVEPIPDPSPDPSDLKLVAGDFSGNSANISTSVAPAIGDFSNAAGSYFLRTPTDEAPGSPNNGNDQNGVWFGNPGMPPTAAFTLPDLTGTGWVYEGWLVTANGPISTGTFTDFSDRDSQNALSGTLNNAGPPIPGEDFFTAPAGSADTYPIDVRGKTIVISVEPAMDNSSAPFLLKPLISEIDMTAATAPTAHAFSTNLGSLPIGTVSR